MKSLLNFSPNSLPQVLLSGSAFNSTNYLVSFSKISLLTLTSSWTYYVNGMILWKIASLFVIIVRLLIGYFNEMLLASLILRALTITSYIL